MTSLADVPVLVLHHVGDEGGGGPWREALRAAGWRGAVHAPDLPGHQGQPPPVGGHHEPGDPFFFALAGGGVPSEPPDLRVVVGAGASGWPAAMLAAAGRARALVLVDGLGGPWLDPVSSVAAGRDWLRALLDDPAAMAAPPADGGLDPRLRHGVGPIPVGPRTALATASAVTMPALVVESPASTTPSADRDDVLAALPDATLAAVESPSLATVAAAIVAWAAARPC
jgi:hypothetical protein